MADVTLKPGQTVTISGQYVQVTERVHNRLGEKAESTLVQGDKAPPTSGKGVVWMLVDATKHADSEPADDVAGGATAVLRASVRSTPVPAPDQKKESVQAGKKTEGEDK